MPVQREKSQIEVARKATYHEARSGGFDVVDLVLRSELVGSEVKFGLLKALNAAFAFGVDKGAGYAMGEDSPEIDALIEHDRVERSALGDTVTIQRQIDGLINGLPNGRKLSAVFDLPFELRKEQK